MIQARHLFYGIAMLDKFKGLGWKKPYLIYGMCDETFSINCSAEIPEGIDRGWFYFFVTLLNQFYWVASATLGGVLGSYLSGAVAEGKAPCQRMDRPGGQCGVPAALWGG